jgi:oxygen-independent coproporphyrinogen-3 oxidase
MDAFLRGEDVFSERAVISPSERESERVMLSLRTAKGLDLSSYPRAAAAEDFFRRLEGEGLCQKREGRWALTPRGYLVSNAVIVQVLEKLGLE